MKTLKNTTDHKESKDTLRIWKTRQGHIQTNQGCGAHKDKRQRRQATKQGQIRPFLDD